MRTVSFVLFILFSLISMVVSYNFYSSFFPEEDWWFSLWGVNGIILDFFKYMAIPAAIYFMYKATKEATIVSLVLGIAFLVLTGISIFAYFGYFSDVQQKLEARRVAASVEYRTAETALETAQAKVESLAVYADAVAVEGVKSKIAQLQAEKRVILQKASSWTTDCRTPKRDRNGLPFTTKMLEECRGYDSILADISALRGTIDGHRRYLASLEHRDNAMAKLSTVGSSSGAVTSEHSAFVNIAGVLGVSPVSAKFWFMAITAVFSEILGSLSLAVHVLMGYRRVYTVDELMDMKRTLMEQGQDVVARLSSPNNEGSAGHGGKVSVSGTDIGMSGEESIDGYVAGNEDAKRPKGHIRAILEQSNAKLRERLGSGATVGGMAFSSSPSVVVPLSGRTKASYDRSMVSIYTLENGEIPVGSHINAMLGGVSVSVRLEGFASGEVRGREAIVSLYAVGYSNGMVRRLSSQTSPGWYRAVETSEGFVTILLDDNKQLLPYQAKSKAV